MAEVPEHLLKRSRERRKALGLPVEGEEADAPEVDPDHRDAGAEQPCERAEDRPVAADGDHELRLLRLLDDPDACALRRKGFIEAQIPDPTRYA